MNRKHNKSLVPIARILRKNMTKEERRLWHEFLKSHPARFTRQKIIGIYIADFYSAKAKLIIEVDGSQHHTVQEKEKDIYRSEYFKKYGLTVVRVSNDEIAHNFVSVCNYLEARITLNY